MRSFPLTVSLTISLTIFIFIWLVFPVWAKVEDFSVTPTPTKTDEKTNLWSSTTGNFTIALVGDSMVDVMQPELPQLASALKRVFPKATFNLYNFGVGASNLEYASERRLISSRPTTQH